MSRDTLEIIEDDESNDPPLDANICFMCGVQKQNFFSIWHTTELNGVVCGCCNDCFVR